MSDILGYKGKRVIVSGCFSGMGQATAKMLVGLGAEVHGFDYKDVSADLASFNKVDLRDPASIDAGVAAVGGKIDALFNCAGLPQTAGAMAAMQVNFAGTRHLTEKVMPLMSGGGAVVSISSNGGLGWSRRIPVHMQFIANQGFEGAMKWAEENAETVGDGYSFSKEAVIVWTMLMSQSAIHKGIRMNCTMPGPTETPMMRDFESVSAAAVDFFTKPIGRRSTPEEQAGPLVFLNSGLATFINGVCLSVDGGFMGGMATGQIDPAVLMKAAGR